MHTCIALNCIALRRDCGCCAWPNVWPVVSLVASNSLEGLMQPVSMYAFVPPPLLWGASLLPILAASLQMHPCKAHS
jgi:hypothetical protein